MASNQTFTAQRWTTRSYGSIDNLCKETVELPQPSDGQVIVSVRAIGLNFADVYGVLGLYSAAGDPPYTPGFEVSGVIAAMGPGVPSTFQVGDRVLGLTLFGGYTTAICLDHRYLYPLPADWTFEQGAAWPAQALTAWYALCIQGAISKTYVHPLTSPKKRVLIHSAAGGVGLMLIQLVHKLGGQVVATIGSASKIPVLQERGIDPKLIIVRGVDDKELGFERTVRKRLSSSDGKEDDGNDESQGVDVVIDSILGPYFKPGWNLLNRGGRYITIGAATMMPSTSLSISNLLSLFTMGWKFLSRPKLDLLNAINENKTESGFNLAFLFDCIDLFHTGFEQLTDIGQEAPFVSKTYLFDDGCKQALRDFQTGRSVGKLIIVVGSDS